MGTGGENGILLAIAFGLLDRGCEIAMAWKVWNLLRCCEGNVLDWMQTDGVDEYHAIVRAAKRMYIRNVREYKGSSVRVEGEYDSYIVSAPCGCADYAEIEWTDPPAIRVDTALCEKHYRKEIGEEPPSDEEPPYFVVTEYWELGREVE
jgi:hypothetical protein